MIKKENDLDLLKKTSKTLKLANKEIVLEEMSAGKTFRAVDKYQRAVTKYYDSIESLKDKSNLIAQKSRLYKLQDDLVDLCLFIIKPEKMSLIDRLKYFQFNKRWLYKNATKEQLTAFTNIVLDPFIGEDAKKKIETMEAALKK